ncbi:MAG: hypothetical protein WBE74_07375 [Terracidiphilus sp.]
MASGSFSFAQSKEELEAVRHHLDEVVHGAAFKGSPRSQQFLRYIVEKALEGEVNSLKERTIGVELFQRSPTYDTGQDAIVRVTASDVRRRLLEHYGRYGDASQFHIQLTRGSYVPEITVLPGPAGHPKTVAQPVEAAKTTSSDHAEAVHESDSAQKRSRRWAGVAIGAAACLVLLLGGEVWRHSFIAKSAAALPPWSVILKPGHETEIITSDPNIEELQELVGRSISISDYANHRFIPDGTVQTADEEQFFRFYQHADNAAAVDTPLAVSIARLAPQDLPIQIHSARSLHITDLQNDDNIILIGSPRSNPWAELFQDQMDFRFVFHQELNQEIVENVKPRGHEQAQYLPTARGFATGESFALVALVHNGNRSGRVLLLAGASGEGTEAVGHLVTDREHLVRLLQYCGISASGPVQDFELLLQLRTLAGSPSTTNMLACHVLPSHK